MTTSIRSTRGFSLIEIMIALVLMGLVSTVIYKMLVTTQRVTDAQAERTDVQTNLRAGALVIPNELRQITISTASSFDSISDIRAITDTSITYRAMRGFYTICATPGSATTLSVVDAGGFASEYRAPTTSDSAFVFWEGDTTKTSDDSWVQVGISAVSTSTCTYAGASRTAYNFTFMGGGVPNYTQVQGGSPVRTYETVALGLYSYNGQQWLGMAINPGASAPAYQPVVGPLAATSGGVYGFQLTYYDSTGTAVSASSSNIPKVRTIKVALRAISNDLVALSGKDRTTIQDSLVTYVTLRNAPFN